MDLQNKNIASMDTPAAQTPEQILEQDICIGKQLYQFERREIFGNKLSIMLPKNFQLMEACLTARQKRRRIGKSSLTGFFYFHLKIFKHLWINDKKASVVDNVFILNVF